MITEQSRIGWIGAGRMGHAMAARLLKHGRDVTVWNRTRAKAEDLIGLGGHLADTIAELADRDIVFTMVSADADLLEVMLGEGGLLKQESIPAVIVDSSTVSAATSDIVREAVTARGSAFLVCPVSGNAKVVKAGRLSIAASGSEEIFSQVEPLLSDIAASVTYVGEGDLARLVKIAHNVFLGVVTQSLAEITVLAEQGGVSRAAFLDFLNRSVMGSTFSRYKAPAMVNLDLTPTFTTTLLRKDLDLGLAAARALNVTMPLTAATHALVQAAIGRGHGDADFAALLVEQARSSGVELKPENVEVDDGLGTAPQASV
ncbi:NAD(P)-dependent oxidoreductase [Jatrophihabitans telluris]|uniref:NAD(P)-dependent oxidoreductase n=1 Tax=Jatrophihabitans telluris TaxID=2038343 RepID=A0ABY4QY78_9ACTN|nr:NAD(P)-dependent oxidoreductase [Jatrophihabitans telluris]UQX88463.1 NAD(P)-dependent oxidoreductase [Jatrophihabitans telluris]